MKDTNRISEIEKNFDKLRSFFENENSKISNKFLKKSKQIVNQIESDTWFRRNIWNFITVSLIILAIVLYNWDYFKFYILYILRLVILLASYFYDFTQFYQNNCLVSNPNFVPRTRFDPKVCRFACGKSNGKKILKTYENEKIKKLFDKIVYESDVPVIINNEMNNWKLSKMQLKDITELFNNPQDPILQQHLCYFDHTIQEMFETKILTLEKTQYLSNFSVMWENCGKSTSKKIRKLIQRPSFLPNNLELVPNSWFFVSKNNTIDSLNIPASLRISLFCQISGKSKIKIIPVHECKQYCPSKSIFIKQGQILVYSDLWNVEFKSVAQEENIVLGLLAQ
ncbi:hypothetical protein BpHYR1_036968 [Brachionus plicatilis]|uniref:Uncharacterized protein n=1 Tax=Brachionus plicatilis TaxID=10195 RepID=A0A3M7SXJ4_BRAPC|nr:hypothetical protein BpHYR1_036968 [Brachionus plicatilis]